MREIKFRLWDTIHKKMSDVFNEPICINDFYAGLSQVIWQQYIGIKDSEGVEIYEGDICVNESGRIAKCIYHGPSASFDFVALNAIGDHYGYLPEYKLTVIGNIYETPELLEKGA